MDGDEGTTIGAGIAWAWEKDKKYGLVAEAHGYMDLRAIKETLEWKIKEMAKIRKIRNLRNKVSRRSFEGAHGQLWLRHSGTSLCAVIYLTYFLLP